MDNLRGTILMIVAMAFFAVEDMLIKLLSAQMPVGQILMALGFGGALIFAAISLARGERLFSADLLAAPVMLRNAGELIGTACFISALALIPLSTASAILQAMPLAVTLGAALFLREPVGWRRWSAIVIGFLGVLLILRPGFEGFEPAALLAVAAVAGLAMRDLATRAVPPAITTMQLSAYAFALIALPGVAMLVFGTQAAVIPGASGMAGLAAALACGVLGYYAITVALRVSEISAIAPFRYTRLVFALALGFAVFDERPDAATLAGAALIIGSGLYTLLRERQLARRAARLASAATLPPGGRI